MWGRRGRRGLGSNVRGGGNWFYSLNSSPEPGEGLGVCRPWVRGARREASRAPSRFVVPSFRRMELTSWEGFPGGCAGPLPSQAVFRGSLLSTFRRSAGNALWEPPAGHLLLFLSASSLFLFSLFAVQTWSQTWSHVHRTLWASPVATPYRQARTRCSTVSRWRPLRHSPSRTYRLYNPPWVFQTTTPCSTGLSACRRRRRGRTATAPGSSTPTAGRTTSVSSST